MLHLTLPANQLPERCWITDVVLRQFLGLEHGLTFDHGETVRISCAGKTLTLSDCFFAGAVTLVKSPERWDVGTTALDARICAPMIPVLFGTQGFDIDTKGNALLSLDVFGSAFFMLTRYEESIEPERDQHDRFPAEASLAARLQFLDRPIVDEYVEILWAAMRALWPTLRRGQRTWRKLISCDVDWPFDPACASGPRLAKRMLGQVCRERSLGALKASVGNYWAVQRGDHARDPYYRSLAWMMDVNEKAGNQVTFNFIPEPTDRTMDNAPSVNDPRMRSLLRTVHTRGHLIGIHPGYNTYRHSDSFARSVATLRRAMDQENVKQDELGGRQHYLRWDVHSTARLWEANALSYDSTLSYATTAGFRAGTCHEYTMYDLVGRCPLALKQRPLIVMENAVIDDANMGLGHSEFALAEMQRYRKICEYFEGDFTLLWHNSSFGDEIARVMYCDLIH